MGHLVVENHHSCIAHLFAFLGFTQLIVQRFLIRNELAEHIFQLSNPVCVFIFKGKKECVLIGGHGTSSFSEFANLLLSSSFSESVKLSKANVLAFSSSLELTFC